MSALRIETLTFRASEKQQWVSGNDEMLAKSSAFPFLKRVLIKKHGIRKKRFFGEAFAASHMSHDEGYYCSFQWLTSSMWTDDNDVEAEDAAEFKRALAKYFPRLSELQAKASTFAAIPGNPKPAAPDLWLVVNGEHRFIEVKLTKDELAPQQFSGLALLANCLPSELPVSVLLVNLDSSTDQFDDYARRLTA